MTLKDFFKSRTFRNNALAVVGVTVFLVLLNMLALRVYTGHGDSVAIPDLKGKTAGQVASLLDDIDLKYQIRDSVYSRETPPGTVLDQFPKPGIRVKENRTVFITLAAVNQELIPMPQLTDISYRQALNVIESSGLVAGGIEYRPSEFPNLVLDQKVDGKSVKIGEFIPRGSVVDLILGGNSNGETSEVPTLFGRNLADARMIIGEALLGVGEITYDEDLVTDDQKARALIWKQSPDPAEVLEVIPGTTINLWLTTDSTKLASKPKADEPDNSFF